VARNSSARGLAWHARRAGREVQAVQRGMQRRDWHGMQRRAAGEVQAVQHGANHMHACLLGSTVRAAHTHPQVQVQVVVVVGVVLGAVVDVWDLRRSTGGERARRRRIWHACVWKELYRRAWAA